MSAVDAEPLQPLIKMPPVSVIMPVYNQQNLVGAAIKSILYQSFEEFEFIVVDDGSTDNTVGVIEQFDDPRISLIKAEHRGFIEALKIATSHARGKWLARMDSDDISAPARLERQLRFLEQHPECKFVTSVYGILTPRNKALMPAQSDGWKYISPSDISLNSVPFCDPGTMYEREAALKKGYDEEFGFEKTLWYGLLDDGKGALIEEALYFIRWRIGSVSRGQYSWPPDLAYQIRRKYDPINALEIPSVQIKGGPSKTEKKTVYYYCAARDFKTAREIAFRLWRRNPFNLQSMKLMLLSLGFRTPKEIHGPGGLRMLPTAISEIGISVS